MPLSPPTPPTPWYLGDPDNGGGAAGTLTAGLTYLVATTFNAYAQVTAVRCRIGTGGTGTVQGGLYDANGNLLASSAATTTAAGIMTLTFTAPVSIAPGRYYLALWISNNTDTVQRYNAINAGITSAYTVTGITGAISTSFNPATGIAETSNKLILLGLISGGLA